MKTFKDDLVVGAQAIAEELGLPLHSVYYLASIGVLPVFRLGKRKMAIRRSELAKVGVGQNAAV